jgi:hypothetical protein
MANVFSNQIQNRNFLSSVGFKFILAKYPKVSFFSNSARIPEISLPTNNQPTYLKDINIPGEKLQYGDFNLRFLVDENMENYVTIHNWITGLGFPESTSQYKSLVTTPGGYEDIKQSFSDGSLLILNSNFNEIVDVKFKDLFPISLSSLDFDATQTDTNYFTAEVTFKYTIYDILSPTGQLL